MKQSLLLVILLLLLLQRELERQIGLLTGNSLTRAIKRLI